MDQPTVSIILVNHNAKEMTRNCIQSIYDQTKTTSFEIILVDNNSTDGTKQLIESKFPQVKLIENRQNKGFSYANNQAISSASGKYLLLLNNDTVVKNEAIEKMIEHMEESPNIGVLTCKIIEPDGKLQRNCRAFPVSPFDTFDTSDKE